MVLNKLKGYSVFHRIGNVFGKYFDGDHFLGRPALEINRAGKNTEGDAIVIYKNRNKKNI